MPSPQATSEKYPEHERLREVKERWPTQAIGLFIDMLTSSGYELCVLAVDNPPRWECRFCGEEGEGHEVEECPACSAGRIRLHGDTEETLVPAMKPTEQIIADVLGVDWKKLQDEKHQMFEELRAANA